MTEYSNPGQTSGEYEMKAEGEALGSAEQPFAGLVGPAKPASKAKQLLKRFAIPVGIIISVLILFSFLSWSSGGSKDKASQSQVIAPKKEAMATPVTPTQPIFTPTSTAPIAREQISSIVSAQISQSQGALQSKLDEMAGQLATSRDQIATLTTNIDQSKQDIAAINQNISSIVSSLQNVTTTLQKLTTKPKPKKVIRRAALVHYHIKAIVPGRVWLESSAGKLVTLRVGDKLAGYGTVDLISPRQGLVITSSGAQIQYGVNDI